MGRVGYNQFEGLRRLGEARAKLDDRAGTILTLHAALEREMDIVLSQLLPRAGKLYGLGFGQKISVLQAAWKGPPEAGDKLCHTLLRFNELRNAIAHGDKAKEVDKKLKLLADAFEAILPGAAKIGDVELVAAGIVGYLADGPLAIEKLKIPIPARPAEAAPVAARGVTAPARARRAQPIDR